MYDASHVDSTLLAGIDDLQAVETVTHVICFSTPSSGMQRVTVGSQRLTIGRSRPADVLLESSKVSRQHCAIEKIGGALILTDLGSTNGTCVDGQRISKPTPLNHGAVIAVGGETLTYERLSERDLATAQAAERELQSASAYVQMLLPKPMATEHVQANWLFIPCSQLGGSGFGYRFLSPTLFTGFFIEVAGQGLPTAMHSVAVMNLLRQRDVAGIDFSQPESVLSALAHSFPAEANGGLFLSACYFTYDVEARIVRYAAAGRAPAYLAHPCTGNAVSLTSSCGPIGLRVDEAITVQAVPAPIGSRLVMVSDGICDRLRIGSVDQMHALAVTPSLPEIPAPLQMHQLIRTMMRDVEFEEDFVALIFNF